MSEHFNDFENEVAREKRRAEQSRSDEQKAAYEREAAVLERQTAYTEAQRDAIIDRQKTLEIASSLSVLLSMSAVRPEIEGIIEEPIMRERGLFKKRLEPTGETRKQITHEGWLVTDWKELKESWAFGFSYDIILTPDNNINQHSPLVWVPSGKGVVRKANVRPLSRTPLDYTDMPWPIPEKFDKGTEFHGIKLPSSARMGEGLRLLTQIPDSSLRSEVNPSLLDRVREALSSADASAAFNRYITIDGRTYDRWKLMSYIKDFDNFHTYALADYETYRKSKFEKKIRTGLARIASRYDLYLR